MLFTYSLIAPTSHERISMIAKEAEGFVYCVSSLGVTGMRSQITTDIGAMVQLVKAQKDIPCAVGFGISTPEQAKKMAAQADGVIVGSAIVKLCETYGEDCVPYVGEYVKSMKIFYLQARENHWSPHSSNKVRCTGTKKLQRQGARP